MRSVVAVVVLAVLGAPVAWAQQLDPASATALAVALQMLQDPTHRAAALARAPAGKEMDQKIRDLTGSDSLTEEFYQVAAEVFDDLTRSQGGDVEKISRELQEGQKDPAAFVAMLGPATLRHLQQLATKLSDRRR